MKLVDNAPGSAGKDSSFSFSSDKGQAWEAPTVCGWGEDTGEVRAEGWSWELRPNLPTVKGNKACSHLLISVPLAGALLGWRSPSRRHFQMPQLPDLALEQPLILWEISNTLFLAQTPGWGPLATANLAVLFFVNFGFPLPHPLTPLLPQSNFYPTKF